MLSFTILGLAFFAGGIAANPLKAFEKRQTACVQEALAVVTPCPECPADQYPSPITITTQNQAYSTYVPMNTVCAADGSCTTAYEVSSGNWLSTTIPCYGAGYKCTVTDAYQAVTISAAHTYSVDSYGCESAGIYTIPNGDVTTVVSPTTIYYAQAIQTYYVAPYNQLGQYALPGYEGSGLCEYCDQNQNGQVVTVQRCCNGICDEYTETWSVDVSETPQTVYVPYIVTQVCTTNGAYTLPGVDITVTVTDAPTTITVSTSTPNIVTATQTNTNTLTGSSTTTDFSTSTAIADTTIDDTIIIQVAPNGLSKRDAYNGYISIVDDLAVVDSDESNAAHFTLDSGVLMYNGKFVGANNADIENGNARFQLFDSPPDVAATWAAVLGGGINFSNDEFTYDAGDAGYCSDSSGNLYLLFTSEDGLTCTTLQLTVLDGGAAASPTTTDEPVPTATPTDTDVPSPTDTSEPTSTDTDTPLTTSGSDEPTPTTSDDTIPTSTDGTTTPTSTDGTTTSPATVLSSTTSSTLSSTTSLDPSADGEFNAAAETAVAAKQRKRSFRADVVRRGGLFRSPLKKKDE